MKRNLCSLMVVLVLGTIAYLPSLWNGFVYDDEYTVVKNSMIKIWQCLPHLVQRDYFALSAEKSYRPLVTLSYFLDYALWRLNPFGYHLTNLLLHLATAAVLFLLLTALTARGDPGTERGNVVRDQFRRGSNHIPSPFEGGGQRWGCFSHSGINPLRYVPLMACALFVVHPINSEAVNCISFREDLLCAFLYIGALFVYVSGRRYGLSLVFFGLALLSKEMAVTLPAMVVVYDLLLGPRCHEAGRVAGRRRLRRYVGYILVLALYAVVAFGVLRGEGLQVGRAPGENLLSACLMKLRVVACDLGSFFFPARLSAEYAVSAPGRGIAVALLTGLALLCAFLVHLLRSQGGRRVINQSRGVSDRIPSPPRQRRASLRLVRLWRREGEGGRCAALAITDPLRRLIFFGCAWFFVTLIPVSGIYPIFNIRADRYMYIPSMGLCLAVSLVLSRISALWEMRSVWRRIVAAVLFLALVCLMKETRARNRVWATGLTLWDDAAKKAPGKARPYANRGVAYLQDGEYERAFADFNKALSIDPDNIVALSNRGNAHDRRGAYDRAIADFDRALRIDPNRAEVYNNRGLAFKKKGEYGRAISDFNNAVRLTPLYTEAYNNRGVVYLQEGVYERAFADFNKALSIDPDNIEALSNRGTAHDRRGAYDRAIADFDRALRIGPNRAEVYNSRGIAFKKKGEYGRAISDFNNAVRLTPLYTEAYNNRGVVYLQEGVYERAFADFNKALSIDPDNIEALSNRGTAHDRRGAYDLAIADFDRALRIDPSRAEVYNNRGIAFKSKGEYDRAISDFNSVVRIDPLHSKAYNNRGITYLQTGDVDAAIHDFSECIRIDPRRAEAYTNRGSAYGRKGDSERAIADFNTALAIDPRYAEAYRNRGIAYSQKGDPERAREDFEKARAMVVPR